MWYVSGVEWINKDLPKYNIKYAMNNSIYDCEHRYFHLNAIKKNNCRICIYKKYLFPRYTGDHTNILNK